jgi:hypothetical protein
MVVPVAVVVDMVRALGRSPAVWRDAQGLRILYVAAGRAHLAFGLMGAAAP